MGKGDKRSKKGKTNIGSYGNSRPKKAKKRKIAAKVAAKKKAKK